MSDAATTPPAGVPIEIHNTASASKLLVTLLSLFAIIFIAILIMLTFFLDIYYKYHQCMIDPNFWCSDEYYCDTLCNGTAFNPCFSQQDHLASCLYGPGSTGATACGVNDSNPGTSKEPLCQCSNPTGSNCLAGCNTSINGKSTQQCSCKKTVGGQCQQVVPQS